MDRIFSTFHLTVEPTKGNYLRAKPFPMNYHQRDFCILLSIRV